MEANPAFQPCYSYELMTLSNIILHVTYSMVFRLGMLLFRRPIEPNLSIEFITVSERVGRKVTDVVASSFLPVV